MSPNLLRSLSSLMAFDLLSPLSDTGSLVSPFSLRDIPQMSFESNLKRLEQIVAQLEGDRLDLSASLALFEEGIELLRQASEELNETEVRVKELVERADGALELRDFGG